MITALKPDPQSFSSPPAEPTVGVVIPFHGRGDLHDRCLEGISGLCPSPSEVVVVGDGVSEADLESARLSGFRVLSTADRNGPAAARNLGVTELASELVLFVDADVVIPSDTVERVRRVFNERPATAAVFGSYDHLPPARNLVSRYKNLLHHWTHQHAAEEASTFWTGCGAVRRAVFMELGGFDPEQEWLEDVEFGYRLNGAGHPVVVDRTLQVTHLKRWTLPSLLISDIRHRAWPWTELMCRYRALPRDLNTDLAGRVSGGLSVLMVAALLGCIAAPFLAPIAGLALVGIIVLNRSLYRLFLRRGGPALMLSGVALHVLYLVYGTSVFVVGNLWWRVVGTRRPKKQPAMAGRIQDAATDDVEPAGSRPSAERRSA